MADHLDQTGVIQVNGAWVTSVKYSVAALGPDTGSVDLRFMQRRSEVGRVATPREHLGELLGEQNRSAIERHIANDADKYLAIVAGELRGQQLHYRQVTLATSETTRMNSIGPTAPREHGAGAPDEPTPDVLLASPDKHDGAAPNSNSADARGTDAEKRRHASNAPMSEAGASAMAPVPSHIAAKYLIRGNRYHFDDETVALIDKGSSLTVQTHNKAIVQDLIAIAQARNWHAVRVKGTQAFRREVWSAATAAGLTVSGYTPTALEQAVAERARSRREETSSPERRPREASSDPPGPQTAQRSNTASQSARRRSPVSEKDIVSATKAGSPQELGEKALTREQEAAAAIRSAAITREELQLKYPELNKAVFQHLASHDQFAEAYIKSGLIRESDRAQVITQMRERLASRLERGVIIREPDDKEVNTLIRRSVNRVAADIGRAAVEIRPRSPEAPARTAATRDDSQVRA